MVENVWSYTSIPLLHFHGNYWTLRCMTTKRPREDVPWICPPVEQYITNNMKGQAHRVGRGTSPIRSQLCAGRNWVISTTLQPIYPKEGPGTIYRRILMGLGTSLGDPTGIRLQTYPGCLSPSSIVQLSLSRRSFTPLTRMLLMTTPRKAQSSPPICLFGWKTEIK